MDDKQFSQELNGIKAFIEDYLLTRCRLKGKLQDKAKDLDRFFKNDNVTREQLDQQKLEIETYIKQCALYDHEYLIDTYKYHIEFQQIEVHDEQCRVTFTTNEVEKYRCTEEVTMIKGIPHSIVMNKQRGRWYITEHLTLLEFVEALQLYQKKTGYQSLEKVQKAYLEDVYRAKESRKPYSIKSLHKETGYDREAVVEYALKNALKSTEKEPDPFDVNTQFALDCMEQGGWTWSTKVKNGLEEDLRKGDIVKISNLKEGMHSMIVTGYIHSLFSSHKVIGYLMSQQGGNEVNVPLATKPYPREYILIDA